MRKITSLILLLSVVGMGACKSNQQKEEPVQEEPATVEVKVGQELIGTAYFDTNVYNKTASTSYTSLKSIIERLSATTGVVTILVNGHTDRVGSEAYNQKLSLRRAEFIKSELVKAGVPKERIVTKGYGFSQPVAEEKDSKTGNAKNRRAEVFFDISAE